MLARFALALGITADELIGLEKIEDGEELPSLALIQRMKKIEKLPESQKRTLLKTIDMFLKAAGE